jgi:hypothetical protein
MDLDTILAPLAKARDAIERAARQIVDHADILGIDVDALIRAVAAELDGQLKFGPGPVGRLLESWDGPAIERALRLSVDRLRE